MRRKAKAYLSPFEDPKWDEIIFPIPIRGGARIVRLLLPKNLTIEETDRVCNVLKAFAHNPVNLPSGPVLVEVSESPKPEEDAASTTKKQGGA